MGVCARPNKIHLFDVVGSKIFYSNVFQFKKLQIYLHKIMFTCGCCDFGCILILGTASLH